MYSLAARFSLPTWSDHGSSMASKGPSLFPWFRVKGSGFRVKGLGFTV